MKTDMKPKGALRLEPCSYGLSKISFRGPMRPTDGQFIAVLGGSDTFAKYVDQPFTDLIEAAIGTVCVNLGCQSAGPDVFLRDTAIQSLCHDAAVTVIEVIGAINQSNAFYKVHPRRNDRFIKPTDRLKALFPEIDYSEISFTGHLIAKLRAIDESRFKSVRAELEKVWVQRMKALIAQAGGPVILLWLAPHLSKRGSMVEGPALVTREMLDIVRADVADFVEVRAEPGEINGLCFAPLDELNARASFGANVHISVAQALRGPVLRAMA